MITAFAFFAPNVSILNIYSQYWKYICRIYLYTRKWHNLQKVTKMCIPYSSKLVHWGIWSEVKFVFRRLRDLSTKNASCTVEWTTLKSFMTFLNIKTHNNCSQAEFSALIYIYFINCFILNMLIYTVSRVWKWSNQVYMIEKSFCHYHLWSTVLSWTHLKDILLIVHGIYTL